MLLPLSRSVIAANSVLIALASIAVVLRIIARRKQHLPLKTDDFLIIAALVRAFFRREILQDREMTLLLGDCLWPVYRGYLCRSYQHICHSYCPAFSVPVP